MRVYKIVCRDVRERDPAVEEASEREGEKERETESKRGWEIVDGKNVQNEGSDAECTCTTVWLVTIPE